MFLLQCVEQTKQKNGSGYACLLKLVVFIHLKHTTTFFKILILFKDFVWFEANEKAKGQDLPQDLPQTKLKK
jgi:hypothetical protein